jgi:hypothetical protein
MTNHPASKNGDYESLKGEIDKRYPSGRFVAIQSGECIADAESHRELVRTLAALGQSPKDMLVVQAGVEYPKSAVILFDPSERSRHA